MSRSRVSRLYLNYLDYFVVQQFLIVKIISALSGVHAENIQHTLNSNLRLRTRVLVRKNLFLCKPGSCVCLLNDYSLLRNLKRGDRKSAKDPVTLINNSNVKILISIFITRNQRIVEEKTRNDWILVWHYQTYKFDRSRRCRSLRWNDWVNRCLRHLI